MTEGPKYAYYPKLSKSYLIVKQHYKKYAERIFTGQDHNRRYLGGVLGDISFKEQYFQNGIQPWKN